MNEMSSTTYAVQQIQPAILSALKSTDSYTSTTFKDRNPNQYNDIVNILTSDPMTLLQTNYSQNTNFTDCLNAESSSYSSKSDDVILSDLKTLSSLLERTLPSIQEYNLQSIADAIYSKLSDTSSSTSTSSDDVPQMYTLTDPFNLNTLLGSPTLIGTPSTASICSLKQDESDQTLSEKSTAIAASTLINSLTSFDSIPSAIPPAINLDSSVAAIAGGFGDLYNTNNFSSSDATNIASNRSTEKEKIDSKTDSYNSMFTGYITKLLVPMDILTQIQNVRQDQIIIPAFYDSNGTQINTSSSDPYANGYIPAGESCTTAEIANFNATYRLQPYVNSDSSIETSSWQKNIQSEHNIGLIEKDQTMQLAQMLAQLYKTQEALETELVINATTILDSISANTSDLTSLKTSIEKAITKYNEGGGKTDTSSTATTTSTTTTTSSS